MGKDIDLEECTFSLEGVDGHIWAEMFPDVVYLDSSGFWEGRNGFTLDLLYAGLDLDYFRDWYDAGSVRDLVLYLVNEAAYPQSDCPVYLNAYLYGRYLEPPQPLA